MSSQATTQISGGEEPRDPAQPGRVPRRIRLAVWLAFVGLAAACIAAIGPAEKLHTTYSWPPAQLPAGTPDTTWFAPLILAAKTPESLAADIPCTPARPLPGAGRATVLSTARAPERTDGFAVVQDDRELTFAVGETVLARVPASGDSGGRECAYQVTFEDDGWSLAGGPAGIREGGDLGYMPVVTGLFSELDLREGPAPGVSVTTQGHATRTIARQSIAWIVAALAIVAALLLVSFSAAPRGVWARATSAFGDGVRALGVVDAVVGVALLAWWILSPAFYDDGWVLVRQRGFEAKRGFSDYYAGLGNNLPNGYWLEWLQHWVTQSFETLLVLRIPALVCLAATWLICRWILSRVVDDARAGRGLAVWVMASMFVAGAMAWGMTLRPEPTTALLVTGALASAIRFSERPGPAPIALLAVLVPLAVTGHHAGIVSVAPLVVIAVPLYSWVRRELRSAVAIATAAFALLVVLVFIGSDISQRVDDARATRTYGGFADTWRDEAARYDHLSIGVFANPLRRGWVALALLVVLAYLLRRHRRRTPLDIPAASLGVALILLIATPSKWPFHFGALIGTAAVAIASGTVRLRRDEMETPRWSARPFVVVGAALLAVIWAVGLRLSWNPLDLRTLDWTRSTARLSGKELAVVLVIVLAAWAVMATRMRGRALSGGPWYLANRAGLIVTVPLIAVSAGVFAVDAAKTDGWTLARQNLRSLRGDAKCGLAEELLVPVVGSVRSGAGAEGPPVPAWLPPLPVEGVPRHLLGNSLPGVPSASPWYSVPTSPTSLFVSRGSSGLAFEWGRRTGAGIEPLGRDPIGPPLLPGEGGHALPWALMLSSEVPLPRAEADSVRIVLEEMKTSPGSIAGVSAPVTYRHAVLADRLGEASTAALVHPTLVTYFPCARQPEIRNGVVRAPELIVTQQDVDDPTSVVGTPGPFQGALDLYRLDRLSLGDSPNAPVTSIVFGVDKRVPGALEAHADVAATRE